MEHKKRTLALFFSLLIAISALLGCAPHSLPGDTQAAATAAASVKATAAPVDSGVLQMTGVYTSRDDVALYIHMYGTLPDNFITKAEARALGWTSGALGRYAPGKNIGGDTFGNYEGLLPKKSGRVYTECDIGTTDTSSRGAKRIVFSNDGMVYYTDNHYASFTQLYGGKSP